MCEKGGGTNRCLPHNPVSKFVVKVVTVRTKADESLVNKTLGELNREGKKLPSPSPEVVKNWVETEKFSAQYDPALSEHDRKIQLNRLNRAETENVSGGHFHAWKNLHNAVRSKMTQKIAAAGLLVGMSVSLVGCFANTNPNDGPVVPNNAPTSISQVIGSGEKVQAEAGAYEKITLDKNAPIYNFNNGEGNPEYMSAAGWSAEDGAAGQKLVADYMVKEFVDSNALNGGDKAYQEWYSTTAAKYYADNVYLDTGFAAGQGNPILGNYGENAMPNLIHDGTPREKSLELELIGMRSFEDDEGKTIGIKYSVGYAAEYRVDDKNAVEFGAKHTNMSPEDFLKSDTARPSLRDGTGENVFVAKGTANVVVGKTDSGEWKILGFMTDVNYDTSNFTDYKG